MKTSGQKLLDEIKSLLSAWEKTGIPPRATLHETAEKMLQWKKDHGIAGLWKVPPRMLGATMDDGWGHGIQLILKYADLMGADICFSGLLRSREQLLSACEAFRPDYLGLTILQFDTEEEVAALRKALPPHVKIIAGGPVFQIDPDFQQRTGIDFVARNVSEFMRLLLDIRS